MTVLVTGGAGFIGAGLVHRLVADGHAVRVLDDLSTGSVANLTGLDGVDLVEGSITDADLVGRLAQGVAAVAHLAARASVPRSLADPVATYEVNLGGTVTVLEAARAVGAAVVVASSSSVYGDTAVLPKHEDLPVAPRSPYAASKLAAEAAALAHQAAYGLPVLALRFFNVYGPRQAADHPYAAVVPRFVAAALAGTPVEVHGDGRQTRDFTHVDTVVEVLTRALTERVAAPGPVNLAFGTRTDLLDLLARIEALVGRPVERHHADPRPGDVRDSSGSGDRLAALFPGLTPVDLDAGLASTVAWARGFAT